METPDALQIADVAQRKTSAIVQAYQSDLLDQSTARKELQALDAETGLFAGRGREGRHSHQHQVHAGPDGGAFQR